MIEGTYRADNDFDNLLMSCDSKTMGDGVGQACGELRGGSKVVIQVSILLD